MPKSNPLYGLRRRELAMWVLCAAEMVDISVVEAVKRFETSFVGPQLPPGADEQTPLFRLERIEDFLPDDEEWKKYAESIGQFAAHVDSAKENVSTIIRQASPRWRLDRMPPIDRSLLIAGCAEMIQTEAPPTREILNCQIELAKRYGADSSSRFVNGILDQIRRDLELPFA